MQLKATNLTLMEITSLKRTVGKYLVICAVACTTALYSLSAVPAASDSMPVFSVAYTVENNFITAGKAHLKLEKKEGHYELALETKPSGVFRLTDKGKIKEVAELPSLIPPFLSSKYSYTNFGDKDRNYTSMYNRKKGEATVVRKNGVKRMAIDATAVDRVSMTLELMQILREQPEIKKFSINTIEARGAKSYSFASKGKVKLKTDIGTITATRIDRLRTGDSKRNIVTWFAAIGPDKLPIPVQFEHYKNGKLTARLKITDFSVNP